MTAIYDILETLIGSPLDAYQSTALYMVSMILAFLLIFGLFDMLHSLVTGWWK